MTRVIQVTNIAPAVTKEQMGTLFAFLGKIDDLRLYHSVYAYNILFFFHIFQKHGNG